MLIRFLLTRSFLLWVVFAKVLRSDLIGGLHFQAEIFEPFLELQDHLKASGRHHPVLEELLDGRGPESDDQWKDHKSHKIGNKFLI